MTDPLRPLHDAGLTLPEGPTPLGSYVPAIRADNLLFLSGMLPLRQGRPLVTGRLGDDIETAQGHSAAAMAALTALAVTHATVGLAAVAGVVRLAVHIACSPTFSSHAEVADGGLAGVRPRLRPHTAHQTGLRLGAEGEDAAAHAPNERVDLEELRRVTVALALFLADYGRT
ncbi:Atu1372/SO_1960 family protein [Nonomuraea sp. NPDC048826]|uniref:RidA family protein n=1 Tax=Nonomuraea sp. NPDC048826 TaxID=3364347 RepID=UPI0037153A41